LIIHLLLTVFERFPNFYILSYLTGRSNCDADLLAAANFLVMFKKLANDPAKGLRVHFFALRSTSAAQPGKPAVEPHCEDTAKGSITLSWELPTDDGGKPIKGYVVEKREHGSDKWTKYVSPLNTST